MESYMGSIMSFAFNFNPLGFAACNGATVQIQQNSALFALIGTYYGGNGTNNFMLPNLLGRTPVGVGSGAGLTPRVIGETFGQESMILTQTNLPGHTHALNEIQAGQTVTATATAITNASNAQATVNKPSSTAYWAKAYDAGDASIISNYGTTKNVTMASDAVQVTVTPTFNKSNLTAISTGTGTAFSLAQPSLALNFCICTSGIFPSRT